MERPTDFSTIEAWCEFYLQQPPVPAFEYNRVIEVMGKTYVVRDLPDESGYFIDLTSDALTPYLTINFNDTSGLWRSEKWSSGHQNYSFINVGFNNLEAETKAIHETFIRIALLNAKINFMVRFNERYQQARRELYDLRWRLHQAVLQKYKKTKFYLTDQDFDDLNKISKWSDHNDVFGLIALPDGQAAENLNAENINKNLALTIQITYPGRRNHLRPNTRSALLAIGKDMVYPTDFLPFESRLSSEERDDFVSRVYERFAKESSCEIVRYASFDTKVPRELHDLFLLKTIQTAQKRGMKTIFASADEVTARLFRRYGFQIFAELPTDQKLTKEFLCYLEIGSENFSETVKKLTQSSRQAGVSP